jgi:queuine tRNA-ribosyltransferase
MERRSEVKKVPAPGAVLNTMHGDVSLPAFFPDATRAVIRCLDAQDVRLTGTPGIVMNAYHLMRHPGAKVLSYLGGLHAFTGWDGPILTDSGGFQVYSLLRENPSLGVVRRNEAIFTPDGDKDKVVLSPEKSIRMQMSAKSDIVMCLDWCTHPEDPAELNRNSVDTTVRWGKKCRQEFDRLVMERYEAGGDGGDGGDGGNRPLLFGIVQGGEDETLRRECTEALMDLGFDGYCFGGWPLDSDLNLLRDTLELTASLMPDSLPKYAMGIGKPENVVACARMGYNLFDSVIPTRDARHLRLYVFNAPSLDDVRLDTDRFYSTIYMQDRKHMRDRGPISEACDCYTCRNYSKAYLYHLFRVEDGLANRLATIHNLRFYAQLMDRIRKELGK